ncbi:MAG: CopG family antitoxin [Bacillota bacterium]
MAKKIPEFKTEEEEARFWDEHDSTDFIEEFEPVDIKVAPELEIEILKKRELKKPITLRLEPKQINDVKKIAIRKGLPYQTLIRMWITERIETEKF